MSSLLLRSQSRTIASASASNLRFQMSDPFKLYGKTKFTLQNFQLLNTVYNITSANCNVDFNENSTNKTCALPTGTYNAISLATQLASSLTTASGGYNTYTVSYSTNTKLLTFSAGNAFTLKFLTGTNTATSPWRECGFTSTNGLTAVDSSIGTSATAPFMVNFSNPMSLYVCIQELQGDILTTDGFRPTFYVPVSIQSSGWVTTKVTDFVQSVEIPTGTAQISSLNIKITDQTGAVVNLQGTDWECLLKAS